MEPTRDEIRTWIRNILKERGMTPTALAKQAGIASTTLTRFLSDQDKTVLSFRTIAKIAHASGTEPLNLSYLDSHAPDEKIEPAVPLDSTDLSILPQHVSNAIKSLINNRKGVETWVVQFEYPSVLDQFGYLVNDILIIDTNKTPNSGDVVLAEIRLPRESPYDVFRIYDPPYLIAPVTHPGIRKPFLVDNERVIIKGVITESLRFSADCQTYPGVSILSQK